MSSFTFLYTGFAAYFSSWFDSITAGGWMSIKAQNFSFVTSFFQSGGPGAHREAAAFLHLSTRKKFTSFLCFPLAARAPVPL